MKHDPNSISGRPGRLAVRRSTRIFARWLAGACLLGLAGLLAASQPPNGWAKVHRLANGGDRYAEHIDRLKKKLPHDDFHIVVQQPFVVIGDESPQQVRARAKRTIAWAVNLLKADFFEHDPEHIIDIWLFKDKQSYEQHVEQLFGSRPNTPYGYYSSRRRALVMNISTGGGTLVHEIVHPFIERNFPQCPAWFNEGLASLYEQSAEREGRICGLTNWRLRGLQRAIQGEMVPSFQTLCGTSTNEFYRENAGVHYAQARYLCYYLQEKGLLRDFYRQFCENVDADPTGFATLQSVLDRTDMDAFQEEWEEFVLQLRFR